MAANGVGVPTQIVLSGTGITQVKGANYAVTLSLSSSGGHSNAVTVTGTPKDIAGADVADSGNVVWQSYNAAPNGQAGKVATAATASATTGTVTSVAVGQAVVDVSYPFGDLDGVNSVNFGKVYALLNVQVVP